MTSTVERRIRKREAQRPASERRIFFFGHPGRPDPDPAEIGPNDCGITPRFVRPGEQAALGVADARH
jgi:hypothetical protein